MKIYDTLSRELREVAPNKASVNMYCCGPTVYRDVHVGNLRTFLLSDLIRRTLELNEKSVKVVQNITDVGHMSEDFLEEDKMLAQARFEKRDPFSIARTYETGFHADLKNLNIKSAEAYPRASESISIMQELIEDLLQKGHAYVGSDGSVYFSARSFPSYGALSGNRLDSLKPGHRYDYEGDGAKKFHADWALWKEAGHRSEMIWESPWGNGFPGWHIECSAMSLTYLGTDIDVHVGGIDLRFPHHENERAQSNAATGQECVDLWVHGEHLLFEGRKMSKSAGNVLRLIDVVNRGYDPLSLRLNFLENRYRSQMDLSWDSIAAADATIIRWRKFVTSVQDATATHESRIFDALNEDLDTPHAIQVLRTLEKNKDISIAVKAGAFLFADKVLGLDLHRELVQSALSDEAEKLIQLRAAARERKDWQESDRLRNELKEIGLDVQDGPAGQTW